MRRLQKLALLGVVLWLNVPAARAQDPVPEVRRSPDGKAFVGWFDRDAGTPFGPVRTIVFRGESDDNWFSVASFPRHTVAAWNAASTGCALSNQPDSSEPHVWLITRREPGAPRAEPRPYLAPGDWDVRKLGFVEELYQRFRKTDPNVTRLFRSYMKRIEWLSATVVRFRVACQPGAGMEFSGDYAVTVDTTKPDAAPEIVKLPEVAEEGD